MDPNLVTIPCNKLKEMQNEIASLKFYNLQQRQQLDAISSILGDNYIGTLAEGVSKLKDQLKEAQKDALRWQFLRDQESGDLLYNFLTGAFNTAEEFDSAIDAAKELK